MTIALTVANPRSSSRYNLSGSLSRNTAWAQLLNLPPISRTTQDISGNDSVSFIFRENKNDTGSILTVSGADVVVTDGDTLTISVDSMSSLLEDIYYVDLVSVDGGVTTLWASGVVGISNSLAN